MTICHSFHPPASFGPCKPAQRRRALSDFPRCTRSPGERAAEAHCDGRPSRVEGRLEGGREGGRILDQGKIGEREVYTFTTKHNTLQCVYIFWRWYRDNCTKNKKLYLYTYRTANDATRKCRKHEDTAFLGCDGSTNTHHLLLLV